MDVDDAVNHEGIKQYYVSKIEGLQVCVWKTWNWSVFIFV